MGYNRRGFFPLWDTTENSFRMANKYFSFVSYDAGNFYSVVSYTTTESYAVYCIPEKSSALYPTTAQVFFRCIPQWKIFSSVVGFNGRGFFRYGIQWKKLSCTETVLGVGHSGPSSPRSLHCPPDRHTHTCLARDICRIGVNDYLCPRN